VSRIALSLVCLTTLAACASAGGPWSIASPQRAVTSASYGRMFDDDGAPLAERAEVRVAEAALASAPSPSQGGLFDRPPAPSPWDALPAPSTPAADAELRSRMQLEESPRYAQNQPDAPSATATDATSRALLVYTAQVGLAVHHVRESLDRVEALAREHGGFLASRNDDTIVVRVPVDAFEHTFERIRGLGDVVTQRVQVEDVTEEFRDVQLRIRTLEAMRARVEQLLREANDVTAALAVEQQLERITVELEQLQGRLRFLSDRVAFSTITVRFAVRSTVAAPDFQLPFRWLHDLGLPTLLTL
jgi:hypothetical protein